MILTIAAAFALFTGVNRVQALPHEREPKRLPDTGTEDEEGWPSRDR